MALFLVTLLQQCPTEASWLLVDLIVNNNMIEVFGVHVPLDHVSWC